MEKVLRKMIQNRFVPPTKKNIYKNKNIYIYTAEHFNRLMLSYDYFFSYSKCSFLKKTFS